MTNINRLTQVEVDVQERLDGMKTKVDELVAKVEDLMGTYQFDYTNAKLHDVSYELYRGTFGSLTDDEQIQAFQYFCDGEWDMFTEYLNENDVETEQLGRTSSFYIVPKGRADNELIEPFYENRHIDWTAYDVIELMNERYVGLWLDDVIELIGLGRLDNAQDFYNEWAEGRTHEESYEDFMLGGEYDDVENHLDEIDDLIDSVTDNLNNLEEILIQVNEVYTFIDDYKANQVENFKYWFNDFYKPNYLDEETA